MAPAKSSCLPHLLVAKLLSKSRHRNGNNNNSSNIDSSTNNHTPNRSGDRPLNMKGEKNNNYLFSPPPSSFSPSAEHQHKPGCCCSHPGGTTRALLHEQESLSPSHLRQRGSKGRGRSTRESCSTKAAYLAKIAGNNSAGGQVARNYPWSSALVRAYVLVMFVSVAVYVNSISGDFVHDDVVAIRRNADVVGRPERGGGVGAGIGAGIGAGTGAGGGITLELLKRIFTNDFWGKPITDPTSHKSYRPLCVLTFRLNYLIGGLDPTGYHAVNVVLHALSCVLLMRLCEQVLSYSPRITALAGLLFATHPIHTEAVSGVVGRADVLTCVLYLSAFLMYNRSVERTSKPSTQQTSQQLSPPATPLSCTPSSSRFHCRIMTPSKSSSSNVSCSTPTRRLLYFMTSLLTSGAALLVKEHGVTVLAVCLLYDVIVVNRHVMMRVLKRRMGIRKSCGSLLKRVGIIILWGGILVYMRIWLMGGQPPVFKPEDNPAAASNSILTRCLTYGYVYVLNAWLLLFPFTLSYDWQMGSVPLVTRMIDPRNLLTILLALSLLLLVLVAVCKTKGLHQRRLVVSLLLLMVPFIPASNLFFPVGFVIAERILYIPSLGFILLVAQGLERLSVRPSRGSLTTLYCGLLLCGAWASRTVSRNKVWSSREALFRSGLETLPHNAKMHYNYANLLKDTEQKAAAIRHYKEAIRLWPDYASAHNNLGTLANDSSASEHHYRKAISINPAHAGAYFNLGNLLSARGEEQEAVAALERAVQLDPYFPDPHTSLAVLLDGMGRHLEAESHYRSVVRLRPDDANAHNNLGVFLGNQGKSAEAEASYIEAYTVDATHHLSMVNAARQFRLSDREAEAQVLLERALSISRDTRTLRVAGVLYFNTNQPRMAAAIFKELLALEPDNPSDSIHYAQSLSRLGRYPEAERVLRDVTKRHPGHPEALQQLANVLGLRRKHEEALEVLKKVVISHNSGTIDYSLLASIHCQMGNHHKDIGSMEQAFENYHKAVQLNHNIGEAHLNLGVFYHLKDNLTQASYHYIEANRLMPDNQLVRDNLKKLCRLDNKPSHCQAT